MLHSGSTMHGIPIEGAAATAHVAPLDVAPGDTAGTAETQPSQAATGPGPPPSPTRANAPHTVTESTNGVTASSLELNAGRPSSDQLTHSGSPGDAPGRTRGGRSHGQSGAAAGEQRHRPISSKPPVEKLKAALGTHAVLIVAYP